MPTVRENGGALDPAFSKRRREKKEARRARSPVLSSRLNINSLMDAFVIILCFLLRSFGSDPVQIRQSEQLTLPKTTSEDPLVDAVVIGVSTRSIQVDDEKVVDLRGGSVDESAKREGAEGLLIYPLFEALTKKAQHLRMMAARNPSHPFKGEVLVVADRRTSYRLISEVLYTAGQCEFERFKFVAAEGGG